MENIEVLTSKTASSIIFNTCALYSCCNEYELHKKLDHKLIKILKEDTKTIKFKVLKDILKIHCIDSIIRIKIQNKSKMDTDFLYEKNLDTYFITQFCFLRLMNRKAIKNCYIKKLKLDSSKRVLENIDNMF